VPNNWEDCSHCSQAMSAVAKQCMKEGRSSRLKKWQKMKIEIRRTELEKPKGWRKESDERFQVRETESDERFRLQVGESDDRLRL